MWISNCGASLVAQTVKESAHNGETQVHSLDWEDALEKEMETHSNILAWRIPWTEGTWWAIVHGLQRVGHD